MAPKKKADPLGWTAMNDAVRDCTEEQALAMLKAEKAGECRLDHIERIYKRYNKLRRLREIEELRTFVADKNKAK